MRRSFLLTALALLVGNAYAAKLTLLGEPEDRLAGEYLISYYDNEIGMQQMQTHMENWQDHFASQPDRIGEYLHMNMLHARLTDQELAKVETFTGVDYIHHNLRIHKAQSSGTQTGATQGLDRIDDFNGLDGSYTYLADGTGVDIFVLDTGVDVNHPGWTGVPAEFLADCAAGTCTETTDPGDPDSHGTHVAGTSASPEYGVAKGARVRSVRVLGADGSGSIAGIINGVNFVVATRDDEAAAGIGRPAVINMSLGGGGVITTLNNAVNAAWEEGIVVVVAAGNEAQDAGNVSPASASDVITVGAVEIFLNGNEFVDVISSFSNTGSSVDIFAPGTDITSLRANTEGSLTISGTSMATPHVAGAAAQLLSVDPDRTPDEIKEILLSTAHTTPLLIFQDFPLFAGNPDLMLNVEDLSFADPDAEIPETTQGEPLTELTQAPVVESARCLSTLDDVDNFNSAIISEGVVFDLFVAEGVLDAGETPTLESITFYTSEIITNGIAMAYTTSDGTSYRQNSNLVNPVAWSASTAADGNPEILINSESSIVLGTTTVYENVATLPSALELIPGAQQGIFLTLQADSGGILTLNEMLDGSSNVGNDGIVFVVPGRAQNGGFTNSDSLDGVLPLVNLCYSPDSITRDDLVSDNSGATDRINDSLQCLISTSSDDNENAQNGVMFDLTVDALAAADLPGVFLESFSVFLMDSMEGGIGEVWTTRDRTTYDGKEFDPNLWVLLGSTDDMDMELDNGLEVDDDVLVNPVDDITDIDNGEEVINAPEGTSAAGLMDFDLDLGYELRTDGEPQGFYVTFQDYQMLYLSDDLPETTVIAANEYVSLSGGKGVRYPFGGDEFEVFDMRQFAGEACFTTGTSPAAATSVGLLTVALAAASTLFALLN